MFLVIGGKIVFKQTGIKEIVRDENLFYQEVILFIFFLFVLVFECFFFLVLKNDVRFKYNNF